MEFICITVSASAVEEKQKLIGNGLEGAFKLKHGS